ncbi:MAG TPA: carboxymuconolactone decarboxylase family protein [Candidatus Deferrimicrobium sp.]|nr:carboxymuconolactone decarboxylase family protein [Candidatus Deferrimicrobium sp.]
MADALVHPVLADRLGTQEAPIRPAEDDLHGDGLGTRVRAYCRSLLASESQAAPHALDARSLSLLRLGATMTAGTAVTVWQQRVNEALESGLSFEEIVEALTALAPTIGIDRAVAVAPELARALGYDIDAALERLDDPGLS